MKETIASFFISSTAVMLKENRVFVRVKPMRVWCVVEQLQSTHAVLVWLCNHHFLADVTQFPREKRLERSTSFDVGTVSVAPMRSLDIDGPLLLVSGGLSIRRL